MQALNRLAEARSHWGRSPPLPHRHPEMMLHWISGHPMTQASLHITLAIKGHVPWDCHMKNRILL